MSNLPQAEVGLNYRFSMGGPSRNTMGYARISHTLPEQQDPRLSQDTPTGIHDSHMYTCTRRDLCNDAKLYPSCPSGPFQELTGDHQRTEEWMPMIVSASPLVGAPVFSSFPATHQYIDPLFLEHKIAPAA